MGEYHVQVSGTFGRPDVGIVVDTGPGAPALLEVELRFEGPRQRRTFYDLPLTRDGENVGYASVKMGGSS